MFLCRILQISINRLGETTVELEAQCRKYFVLSTFIILF